MSTTHKDVVERINAAFARNDIEGFLVFCTDDFVWTIVGESTVQGKDAIRQWMANAPPEAPAFSVDTLVVEGDVVVAQGDMTMTEDGAPVAYSFCDVWRFRGRQAVELKSFVMRVVREEAAEPLTRAAGR
jgi:ketosteroid isomerase-like protein